MGETTGTNIARTELLVKSGDSSPFEAMLTTALDVSPFNKKSKEKLRIYYQKYPSRFVDDLVKLRSNLPQYGGAVPINTTNNLVLHLEELSLNQKEKLLGETLDKLGITRETLENAIKRQSGSVPEEVRRSDNDSTEGGGRQIERPPLESSTPP